MSTVAITEKIESFAEMWKVPRYRGALLRDDYVEIQHEGISPEPTSIAISFGTKLGEVFSVGIIASGNGHSSKASLRHEVPLQGFYHPNKNFRQHKTIMPALKENWKENGR